MGSCGGRRSQLLQVTVVIGPLLALTGIAIQGAWSNSLVLLFVCAFALVWQIAWGMIPWVYPSEIFSTSERDRAMSFAVFTQYGANAVLLSGSCDAGCAKDPWGNLFLRWIQYT